MYNNIGGKIKSLATVLCILGFIGSAIGGISFFVQAGKISRYDSGAGGAMVLYGILVIVGGCLLSWILGFFAYGFGQLIENTDEIAANTRRGGGTEASGSGSKSDSVTYYDTWKCLKCGTLNPKSRIECKNCGTLR
ncbi:MAG: zinc finger Ran-binding domain-containing family 2 protein [Clostridia bacterium]|nr:zinc finger Ran-binding domain-containing family 2 protein [Clostridia bacterium]